MIKDPVNKSSRYVPLRNQAVCGAANPRDSYGYHCGLRLAPHHDPQRPLIARLIHRILKKAVLTRGENRLMAKA